jgi:archaemetzincin
LESILDSLKFWPVRIAAVALAGALLLDQVGPYQLDDYARGALSMLQPRSVSHDGRRLPVHWAVDGLQEVPPERRRWFATTPAHRERSWAHRVTTDDQGARGQTVGQFRDSEPPGFTDARRTVYLQPIGTLDGEQSPDLSTIEELLTVYFQTSVEIRSPLTFRSLELRARRLEGGHLQLDTERIADGLAERVPEDAFAVVGVTDTDLYPSRSYGFVFGQAWPGRRVAVTSFARLTGGDETTTLARAFGTIAHEVGHLFGIAHCIYFHCTMNAATTLAQMDRQPLHLGPVDLRKLHSRVGFEPRDRYRQLREVYRRHGLNEPAAWIDRRLR